MIPNSFLNQFPYSDLHELNLDWIIREVKNLAFKMQDFEAANSVSYEGVWEITNQYQKWSIVLDSQTGYLMIAKRIVPAGIAITNTDYWILVSPFKIDTEFDVNSYNAIANRIVTNMKNDLYSKIDNEETARIEADSDLAASDVALSSRIDGAYDAISTQGQSLSVLNTQVQDIDTDVESMSSRIDEIAHTITEGGTSGDAELADIRVGANGITYDNAGTALRSQITNISDINNISVNEVYTTNCSINNVGVISTTVLEFMVYAFRVYKGVSYTITTTETDLVYGFVEGDTSPVLGSITYDNERHISSNKTVKAPITGWMIFRSALVKTTEKAEMMTAYDGISRNAVSLTNTINTYFDKISAYNMFDPSDFTAGYYINSTNGLPVPQADHFYTKIEIKKPGTYIFFGDSSLYGPIPVKQVPVFDENDSYITYITGDHYDDESSGNWYGVSFTISQGQINSGYKYIKVSQRLDFLNKFMVINDTEYPESYIPYVGDRIVLDDIYVKAAHSDGNNPSRLYNKTICFFGDSICHGTSAKDNKNGWAGRIGVGNFMSWCNYGINGGTITQQSGHHYISGDLTTAESEYPDADFIIFEGGTNDADILHEEGLGTFDPDDFSGSYDETTFSGAFEAFIYNAITAFPYAHVGYIVAQKMGTGTQAARRLLFFNRAKELCNKWGIPFIDLWNESKLNPRIPVQWDSSKTSQENIDAGSLYVDGQHLTPDGYDFITPMIEAWIKTI